MRFMVQRVNHASVTINNNTISSIQKGYLVLIGICDSDTKEIADKMLNKLLKLRIFSDEDGKTNLSLKDVKGELLLVSQFTLYYEYIIQKAKEQCHSVQTGEFGADMKVSLENDGPFTIFLDSDELL